MQTEATSPAAESQDPGLGPWVWIALGSLARVLWPSDFEWKYDEKWMFDMAQRVARFEHPWPWIGMPSGVGVENPGASTWPFIGLAHITRDPATMTLLVMLANVIALWAFAFWVNRFCSARNRNLGLWGVALFAVSPLPVLFSRKLWAQSILPVLLVPWLWGHMRRESFRAALAWGAAGALLGQVHLSGFFAAAGLVAATALLDDKRTNWAGCLVGSALAALPMVPWAAALAGRTTPRPRDENPLFAFVSDALMSGWGLNLRYSLGTHFDQFLQGPVVGGAPTRLVLAAHVLLVLLAIACVVLAIRNYQALALPREFRLHALAIALCALAMHLLSVKIYPHYMIVLSPLLHLFVAWLLVQRRAFVWLGCGLQLFVTGAFLWFIHVNGGAPDADYGVAYSAQTPAERVFTPKPDVAKTAMNSRAPR